VAAFFAAVSEISNTHLCIGMDHSGGWLPMYSERTVLDFVGLIYDAAGDERLWPVFLGHLSDVLKSPVVNVAMDFTTGFNEITKRHCN
jgi:hypothetical protein